LELSGGATAGAVARAGRMNQTLSAAEEPAAASPAPAPRVWVVTGYRAGERAQVVALAEALGWPFDIKQLSYRRYEFRTSLLRGSDLRGIRIDRSSPLQPPWPDLVISAGMRNEPVCRWIRAQNGGRTRIVHIGRPWADPARFDLVITTPQYRLPERDNVLQNTATLHRLSTARLAAEALEWAPQFEHLPRPYIGVMLGGNSGPYTLGPKNAAAIAEQVDAMAVHRNGSLLISTSARTHPAAIRAFEGALSAPHYLYRWRRNDARNPYFGMLALGDELVVTADSISMLSEACATGKPVYIAELGGYGFPMRPDSVAEIDFRFSAWTYSWMMRVGPRRLSRDIRLVHRALLEEGRAAWLGEALERRPLLPLGDMDRALERVRALFPGAG
jgi:uncharacterized protein